MCGIAGIVSLTGSTVIDPEIVRRMADAIFRGPDEDGYFFRPGLAMANRRLSIVGLADGRQPMDNRIARFRSSSMASSSTIRRYGTS